MTTPAQEALADLVLASALYLERRDAQGRGLARARLRDAIKAAVLALNQKEAA